MTTPYTVPALDLKAFNCPNCGAFSNQGWSQLHRNFGGAGWQPVSGVKSAQCANCQALSLWLGERMLHPAQSSAPPAHPDLPATLQGDYEEARSVLSASPRGAAALLRLVLQKLCQELGEPGKNLNNDIGALVKKRGLPVEVQQALDVVRVIGNNAVHPGQIDVDDALIAGHLFQLVNLIAQVTIAQPKQIQAMYDSLPHAQKEAIQKRDSS